MTIPKGGNAMKELIPRSLAGAILVGAVLGTSAVHATDVRYIAANCANCHGTDGRAAGGGGMPGLAGLSATYFVEQMNAFRAGKREATIMHQLAKGYTDAEIAQMAAYFAAQKPSK
jgi:cytochrome subunit of sulfide dehydrogenase